ncbi:MAG TPA: right-handed parallel beta-helix repeat-containing protein, partial [Blastocatellia bacterium]|nr:right-handed parallel beta-helix repeat-containing protein [Blastocatellia bacterium]
MSDLRRKSHTRLLFVICALVLTVGASVMALRGVSAETLGKFGITEQSRAGKLIEKIVPRTFAPKRLSPKMVAPSAATTLTEPAAPFATLTVTSGADTGAGTLRNQIAAAASGDTIVFSGVTTVTLTSAELLINKNLTIDGGANGVTITRSGATLFRIFTINSGNTVSFNKLTISNGNRSGQAGGIQNNGTLTMTDCTVSGNTSGQGGGIQNDSVLTMTGCTISGNTATDSDGGGMAAFGTNTTLTNCTFSGNNAIANGGGLSISSGVLVMTNCTVANNTASLSGGEGGALSIANPSLNATLKNTVMIGNSLTVGTTHNVYTQSNFQAGSSNNLLGVGNAGGLTNGVNSNQIGVAAANAPLAALGNYGGATQTHALLPGNPAIDAGTATGAPTTDQRGIARVGTTDIGAYESRGFTMALSSGNNQSATVNTAFALPLSLT